MGRDLARRTARPPGPHGADMRAGHPGLAIPFLREDVMYAITSVDLHEMFLSQIAPLKHEGVFLLTSI